MVARTREGVPRMNDCYRPIDIKKVPTIDCVCSRPRLYTPHGTLAEVVSYLDGYHNGLQLGGASRGGAEWHRFCEWLIKRLEPGFSANWHHMHLYEVLHRHFVDDTAAIHHLEDSFKQLRQAVQDSGDVS